MRRLLMVSYDFPPSSRGIWRTLKFCHYMGEFGWRPAILTVKPVRSERFDLEPLKELPEDAEVRRTGSIDPHRLSFLLSSLRGGKAAGGQKGGARANPKPTNAILRGVMDRVRSWILFPDDRIGWYPFALRGGLRWLREARFDAVYTTSFPNTSHLVGARMAQRAGLPCIADYRDIWIGNYYFYTPATGWHDRTQRRMESFVVRTASRVISATGPITDDFLERYPKEDRSKFLTITNGFDPGDFAFPRVEPDTEHFTITYAGTMYGSTSPKSFFGAVQRLFKRRPEFRDILRLRFVGSMIEPYRAMIGEFGLEAITRADSYLAHADALRAMAEADALLLLVAPVPGSHIMLTQKVFEYVAARRPVIGLVPQGAARDFLVDIGEGPIVAPDDEPAIERALESMLDEWKKGGRRTLPDNPRLATYHRRELTRKLCTALDQVVGER